VKAYGAWAMPLHEPAVAPGAQGRSRFTDQNVNRASWCARAYRSIVWKAATVMVSPVSVRPFIEEMPMTR
jgi:hypothetical protein